MMIDRLVRCLLLVPFLMFAVGATCQAALLAGTILVADRASVLTIDPLSGSQSVLVSGGFLTDVRSVIQDRDGSLLIADANAIGTETGAIIRFDVRTGQQSVVSSGGQLRNPNAVSPLSNGTLAVLDGVGSDYFVHLIDPDTGTQSLLTINDNLKESFGMVIDPFDNIYLSEASNFGGLGGVVRVDPNTGAQTVVTSGGLFNEPTGITYGPDGNLYVADQNADTIIRVDPATGEQTLVSSNGSFINPAYPTFDRNGRLLVSDYATNAPDSLFAVSLLDGTQMLISQGGLLDTPLHISVAHTTVASSSDVSVPEPSAGAVWTLIGCTVVGFFGCLHVAAGITKTAAVPAADTAASTKSSDEKSGQESRAPGRFCPNRHKRFGLRRTVLGTSRFDSRSRIAQGTAVVVIDPPLPTQRIKIGVVAFNRRGVATVEERDDDRRIRPCTEQVPGRRR
jgi:streptogramin lyase